MNDILDNQKFQKRIWSKWWFWLIVVLLGVGSWQARAYISDWGDAAALHVQEADEDAWWAAIDAKNVALKLAYSQDMYGGSTPQETWALFIEALEAGDTDLAAKYYIVEKQKEEQKSWAIAKELGNIPILLNDFETIVGSYYFDNNPDMFEFYTSEIDNGPGFIYTLVRNKDTNIWKILDL